MKRVVIESPLSGAWDRNIRYAKIAMIDCLRRGEAPFASHLLYTQCLDDEIPTDRKLGMSAGFAWGEAAELAAVYQDLGVSGGMRAGIEHAKYQGIPVEFRNLPPDLMEMLDRPRSLLDEVRPTRGFDPSRRQPEDVENPRDEHEARVKRMTRLP